MRAAPKNLEAYAKAQLDARLKKLATNLRKTAKDAEETEHIHDLRVAIRRFTQALRVFDYLLQHGHVRRMKRKLRKVMDLCGETRNCDIAAESLKAAGVALDGLLNRSLEKARERSATELTDVLTGWKISARTAAWRGWLQPEAGPNQTILSSAKRTLAPLVRDFLEAGAVALKPDSTPEEMHRFRLLSKRLRYTLEIFQPVLGSECQQAIGVIRELQEYLGAVNDCVASADLIGELGKSGASARRAKSALRRLLRKRVDAFRKYWRGHMAEKQESWWQDWIRSIE